MDVIVVYKSQEGNITELVTQLENIINDGKHNNNYFGTSKQLYNKNLIKIGFSQTVRKATHVEGRLLDHIYIIQGEGHNFSYSVESSQSIIVTTLELD